MALPPAYRAPRRSLSAQDLQRLAEMRRRGATWHEIGRVFGKQEGVCRRLFTKAETHAGAPLRIAPA